MDYIEKLNASPWQLALAITGGGAQAASDLIRQPGGSQTLLEAVIPYHAGALKQYLNQDVQQFCSSATACQMATVAFQRGCQLIGKPQHVAGVACTASLATSQPKRGEHRVFVAVHSQAQTTRYSLVLQKGLRSREQEEHVASRLIHYAIGELIGARCPLPESVGEPIQRVQQTAHQTLIDVIASVPRAYRWGNEQLHQPGAGSVPVVFPGSFNPLHRGHQKMAEVASQRLGHPVAFEMAVQNVDKPPMDYITIRDRAKQFRGQTLFLTSASRFVEKATIFPGATFVLGVDTLVRLIDPNYYQGDPRQRDLALQQIAQQDCRLLIFGRIMQSEFHSAESIELPSIAMEISEFVSEGEFRVDLSSTQLRLSQ